MCSSSVIFAAISFVESDVRVNDETPTGLGRLRGGGVDALVDICGSCLLLGIVWVFFFVLFDRQK